MIPYALISADQFGMVTLIFTLADSVKEVFVTERVSVMTSPVAALMLFTSKLPVSTAAGAMLTVIV